MRWRTYTLCQAYTFYRTNAQVFWTRRDISRNPDSRFYCCNYLLPTQLVQSELSSLRCVFVHYHNIILIFICQAIKNPQCVKHKGGLFYLRGR